MEWVEYEGGAVQEPVRPRHRGADAKKKGPDPARTFEFVEGQSALWTPKGVNESSATMYWSTPTTGSTYASASSILNPVTQNK